MVVFNLLRLNLGGFILIGTKGTTSMESVTIFTVSYRFIHVFDSYVLHVIYQIQNRTVGITYYKGLQEKAAPKGFKTMTIVWQNSEFWQFNLL